MNHHYFNGIIDVDIVMKLFRVVVLFLIFSPMECTSCIADIGSSYIQGTIEKFLGSLALPEIQNVFNDDIDVNMLEKTVEKIQDKDLHEPIKSYISEVDELAQWNALRQINTEKPEVEGAFDTMQEKVAKLEKYKDELETNGEKVKQIKESLSEKALKYADKQLQKEEKKQTAKDRDSLILKRGKRSKDLVFTYGEKVFTREVDKSTKKEYIIYDVANTLGFVGITNQFDLAFRESVGGNKVKMEVQSQNKIIKKLLYKNPRGQGNAVFHIIRKSDIEAADYLRSNRFYVNTFLRSSGPPAGTSPNEWDFREEKDDAKASVVWQYQDVFKLGNNWNMSAYWLYKDESGNISAINPSGKQTTTRNYSNGDNFELLWVDVSCCCYRKSDEGVATSWGEKCGDSSNCGGGNTLYKKDKGDTKRLDSLFTVQKKGGQSQKLQTSCSTIVKNPSTGGGNICNGKISYKAMGHHLLVNAVGPLNGHELINPSPVTTIDSAPYILSLRWAELMKND